MHHHLVDQDYQDDQFYLEDLGHLVHHVVHVRKLDQVDQEDLVDLLVLEVRMDQYVQYLQLGPKSKNINIKRTNMNNYDSYS